MAVILVFFCLLGNKPLLPRLKENIFLNFEFKNEATRANLQGYERTLKGQPFWNTVYVSCAPSSIGRLNDCTNVSKLANFILKVKVKDESKIYLKPYPIFLC